MKLRCREHGYAMPCVFCLPSVFSARVGLTESGRLIPRVVHVTLSVRRGGAVTLAREDGTLVQLKFSKWDGNVHPYQGRFSLGGRLFQASLKDAEIITRHIREQCGFAPLGATA